MGGGWSIFQFQFFMLSILITLLGIQRCWSLNSEGLALLEFRAGVESDPYGAFLNWNSSHTDACMWLGVHCVGTRVEKLDLSGLSLEGKLAPGLGKLSHLRSLVLQKNNFSGTIPKEIGGLINLEILDLRNNNLSGVIPEEIATMPSLQHLLLRDNKFHVMIPIDARKLKLPSELHYDESLASPIASGIDLFHRKFEYCDCQSLGQPSKEVSSFIPIKRTLQRYLNILGQSKFRRDSSHGQANNCCDTQHRVSLELQKVPNVNDQGNFVRRRLLQQSSNLAAIVASDELPLELIITPYTRSSGAFPAINNKNEDQSPTPAPQSSPTPQSSPAQQTNVAEHSYDQNTANKKASTNDIWKYLLVIPCMVLLLIVAAVALYMCPRKGVKTIGPWATGLSGQLQKAFVTGVPKLNLTELETACEDFSNIIDNLDDCTVYKGTLSSKVEIAVVSTVITSSKDWSKRAESAFWKKIDKLSRVNHKNFLNLLGFCKEDNNFKRMMVFEYAPNGSLFEHLHVKEMDPLDWKTRTRIIMGIAYCLEHMHELNPPIAHPNVTSSSIFLTNCCAAKISEINFWADISNPKNPSNEDSENSELPPLSDPESNVYSFGILLAETLTGKLAFSEEHGPLVDWAANHLNDKENISELIDPTLQSFEKKELDIILEVMQDCIQPDPRRRPTMKEATSKLREVIKISPEMAAPSLSALWWTALELHRAESAEFV